MKMKKNKLRKVTRAILIFLIYLLVLKGTIITVKADSETSQANVNYVTNISQSSKYYWYLFATIFLVTAIIAGLALVMINRHTEKIR